VDDGFSQRLEELSRTMNSAAKAPRKHPSAVAVRERRAPAHEMIRTKDTLRVRAALLIAACAVLLNRAAPAVPAPPPATFVGVLGGDGALTPIAVFDGHDWWNAWPWGAESDEVKALPVPSSLDAIPADWLPPALRMPRDWRVLRRSGATARLKALRPVQTTLDGLMDTFTIATTFRPGADGDALAIAGPGVLGTFVTPSRDETERVLRRLTSRIETLERNALDQWRGEHKGSEMDTASALTRVYMTTGPDGNKYVAVRPADAGPDFGLTKVSDRIQGKTYYYLSGAKLFKVKPADECMINLSSNGLVVVDRGGAVSSDTISSSAYSEYCGDAAESTMPLGTVRIGTRMLWVMRVNLEDGFDYTLFDPLLGDGVGLKGGWRFRTK
jgi:hypothetical protein